MTGPVESAASPAEHNRQFFLAIIAVAATFAVCLIRLCGFVQDNAVNLIFEDQWGFLDPLFDGRGAWACFFHQHGPHRLGLGGLAEWMLYRATDWNVCADAWAAVPALSVAALALVALAARLRGRLSWRDAGFPLVLLGPLHWETMVLTPSLAHSILPLCLTCLLAYAWTLTQPAAKVIAVGVFGSLVLFTGYGICGTPLTIGLAVLLCLRPKKDRATADRRQAGLILLLLCIAVFAFAQGYHWDHGTPGWRFPVPNWWDYPRFCALMFTSLLGLRSISTTTVIAGAMLLVLVTSAFIWAAIKIWRRDPTDRAKAVWVLTGTSLVYSALTAFGRLPINIEAAFMWRYMTLMTPALCGLALAAEEWLRDRPKMLQRYGAVAWIGLAGFVWCNFVPEQSAATIAKGKNLWITRYLQTHDLARANRESNFVLYFPAPDAPFIAERLRWMEQRHLSFFKAPEKYLLPETRPPEAGR